MRVHADDKPRPRVTVLLDGKPLKHCVWADDAAGEAEIYPTGPDGHFIIRRDHVVRTRVRGKITIRPEDA